MSEKLEIFRWQRDALTELFGRECKTYEEWLARQQFLDAHFEVKHLEQQGGDDIKNVYVFFGYKQDATRYRLEHDIDPRDMVNVKDHHMLVGRRARPIRVGQNSEWYFHNFNHQFSIEARYQMSVMEAYYGTANAS
ncbi:hypothetical protein SEA_MEDIUMFRY_77 [Arthrobacter phage MediumFry]|nr:hypothetical protein SEA_MEDIUMFRY_77 [Arthrobacter phage MediumFry]